MIDLLAISKEIIHLTKITSVKIQVNCFPNVEIAQPHLTFNFTFKLKQHNVQWKIPT